MYSYSYRFNLVNTLYTFQIYGRINLFHFKNGYKCALCICLYNNEKLAVNKLFFYFFFSYRLVGGNRILRDRIRLD